ncbi:uncharacterized protein LOC124452203 [Xenia sp. Carnegie-2017]|uniref:uncharacterized protein LOC124452203 n=1 Tax=Xenia sp. Carnegie-2017 TaxID=2897299 RepID=UPI001F045A6E|nr:uncharacterized protein LOC124452203 [Xenia sp. Carnegie-2017]
MYEREVAQTYSFLPREAVSYYLMSCNHCKLRIQTSNSILIKHGVPPTHVDSDNEDLTDGEGSVSSNEKDFDAKKTEEPARKRVKREKVLDNDYIHENSMDILDKFDTSPEGSEQENGSGDPEYVPNGKEMVKSDCDCLPEEMNQDIDLSQSSQMKRMNNTSSSLIGKTLTRGRRGGGGGRRLSYSPETDKQLLEWVLERSKSGLPVTRESIQSQALVLVRDECPDFKASSGWVEKFLIRHKFRLPSRASIVENGSVTRRGPPPLVSNGTRSTSSSPVPSPLSENTSDVDKNEDTSFNVGNVDSVKKGLRRACRRQGKDNKDDEEEDDDEGDEGEGEPEKPVPENVNPERLKAFNVFVRLFVDENLDRLVPISKQPKDKVLAIIRACQRQFPEFNDRARKRIRTYLKSCRRMKKPNEPLRRTADQINSVPSMSSAQMQEVNNILASACANEASLGDHGDMRTLCSACSFTTKSFAVSSVTRLPLAAVGPESLAAARARVGAEFKLNTTDVTAIRQLINGYRESAAFLYRSADELEALLPASMLSSQKAVH